MEKPRAVVRQGEISKEIKKLQKEYLELTGEKWHEKLVRCNTCQRLFTASAEYDYDEEDDKFAGWQEKCDFCRHKISDEQIGKRKDIVRAVENYKNGLLTKDELIKELNNQE